MSSITSKSFRQTRGHHTDKSLANQICVPTLQSSAGFTQNLSSSNSLLLIDTASPPLSDTGSISSGNDSSAPSNNNNIPVSSTAVITRKRLANNNSNTNGSNNLLWLNSTNLNGNNNSNENSSSDGQNFPNQPRTRSGYMTQQSDSNGAGFTTNHSSPLPQRPTSQHSITTSAHNDYSRYHGSSNSSGNILWPLPPMNPGQQQQQQVNCGVDSSSQNSGHHNALLKSQMQTPNPDTTHIASSKSNKKESHNRIERKRRDYINTQIASLGTLLPQELYRGVDGKRNKGSVLKLSVNYITDLRNELNRMNSVKEENHLARQLIPIILQRVKFLEKTMSRLLNECFTTKADQDCDSKDSTPEETIEKKYFKFQKLLYDAISNRFDYQNPNSTGPPPSVSQNNNIKWENFDGIENENRSVLDNDIVQAWLRVFENNKSQEVYSSCNQRKMEFPGLTDENSSNGEAHDNNNVIGGIGKHRFPSDLGSSTAPKNLRRIARNSTNNSLISNSSEASNTDESSPLSNLAANSCNVEHQLFYANQPNTSTNGSSLDNGQSLLLSYSSGNQNQGSGTTDFSLSHLQPADILLSNSSHDNNSSSNNHSVGMRVDKLNEDMLCPDNPILLSSFFASQSYEQNMTGSANGSNNGQSSLLSSEHLHQHLSNTNGNQYQMLLHQHQPQNTSDSVSEQLYQSIHHLRPQSTIANRQN